MTLHQQNEKTRQFDGLVQIINRALWNLMSDRFRFRLGDSNLVFIMHVFSLLFNTNPINIRN